MARSTSTFGALLKRYRLAAGLTQEQLAERASLSAHAVSDLERDPARLPQLESVARLAAALGLAPDQRATLLAAARPGSMTASAPAPPRPATRYARSGDVSVAYQVFGDGPVPLIAVPPFISHLEWEWEEPHAARYLRQLGTFARLIRFDKRGTGLSDRVTAAATMDERLDDVRAVLDAAGVARAVVQGDSAAGGLAMLFAATYPERTLGLILYGTRAAQVRRPDYPWRPPYREESRALDALARTIHRDWGTAAGARGMLDEMAPTLAGDAAFEQWFATLLRLGASPGGAIALWRMNLDLDVRHLLPAIRVPTLVLQRTGDRGHHLGEGRYLADHIPGARFMALPGDDHFAYVGATAPLLAAIRAFLAEVAGAAASPEPDRVLATALAAALAGPSEGTLPAPARAAFRALARRELARYQGERLTVGDTEMLATFDGPVRAVRCAQALVAGAAALGLGLRAGLHTGECERDGALARGPVVAGALRVRARAAPGEVLVTGLVRDLLAGAGLRFADRGAGSEDSGEDGAGASHLHAVV